MAATLVLLCIAPGMAAFPLLSRRPRHIEVALVVAASLGFCVVIAQAMLWLDAWEPAAATYALAALCLASIGAQLAGWRSAADAQSPE